MEDDGLPNARPIALSDSPRCQRSHNSVFSAAVKPRRYPCHIAKHSIFSLKAKVLRRSVETTGVKQTCPGHRGMSAFDPGCVKTHTSEKCRKYNSPTWHSTVCPQHYQFSYRAISQKYFYARGDVEVFTQPGPKADIRLLRPKSARGDTDYSCGSDRIEIMDLKQR